MRTILPTTARRQWTLPGLIVTERATAVEFVPRQVFGAVHVGLVLAGAGRIYVRGAGERIGVGRALSLLVPGEPAMGHSVGPAGWSGVSLDIAPDALAAAAAERRDAEAALPDLRAGVHAAHPGVEAALRRLHGAVAGPASRLERDARVLDVFGALLQAYGAAPLRAWPTRRDHAAVWRAVAYLDAYATREVTLDELARAASLSKYHLARTFREQVGVPPHAYQTHLRVALAKVSLARGVPIGRAALEAGFDSQSHLGRHFRAVLGTTPGAYARAAAPARRSART